MHPLEKTENIIEVDNVSFYYAKGEPVLEGVTFEIHRGDYLGIIGPNGAGKTTLLKIILGLLKPTSGNVRFFGKDMKDFKDWSRISYVPQKATNFDSKFPATVEEVVLMGLNAKKGLFHRNSHSDLKKVKQALEKVEMSEFCGRLIGDLSGGQQQRVFIARALVREPEVIFLDEPTVGIEPKIRDEFYALLRKLNRELDLTLILVSHHLDVVSEETMHVACINKKLEYFGSVKEFLKGEHLRDIGGVKLFTYHDHHH